MQLFSIPGFILTLVHAAPIPVSTSPYRFDVSAPLQNILSNTDNSDAYTYPTDLTRGIVPVPIHSHNDYWRDVPFYSALSVGCVSVESDVWLVNGSLYVGHAPSSLTVKRTFQSLYIEPILSVLQRENPSTPFVPTGSRNGVFDTSSSTSLLLFVDIKTEASSTWQEVVRQLQPLRDAGYLTRFDGSKVIPGPVTVIGTGAAPLAEIQRATERDYFYDADLSLLSTSQSELSALVSPVASTNLKAAVGDVTGTNLNSTQLEIVRAQLAVARSKGIAARYWDTPAWPISRRNAVWTTLVEEGVGLLNADDLSAAAGFASLW